MKTSDGSRGVGEVHGRIYEAIWRDIAPLSDQIEEQEEIPQRVYEVLSECGAFGLLVPKAFGGAGLSISDYLPIIAEFAKVHGGVRVVVHVHNSFAHALSELGTKAQVEAVLPGCVDGTNSVAFALTEPDFGTGQDLGTVATGSGGSWSISGTKWLITNSNIASHFIVFARASPRASGEPPAVTGFLVPRHATGLTIEPLPETMGCKGGEHGRLTFEEVEVPDDAILGGTAGQGLSQLEEALEISRVFIAASSLGTAERALELSLEHARQRVTFGKPIASRQAVQRYLAEMAVDIAALRHLVRDAAERWDNGDRIAFEASVCKLFGLEAVGRVTDRALLVHGGIGYTRAREIERLYRDARLNWLEEGTPTIQHLVIAREILRDG